MVAQGLACHLEVVVSPTAQELLARARLFDKFGLKASADALRQRAAALLAKRRRVQ